MTVFGKAVSTFFIGLCLACYTTWASTDNAQNDNPQRERDQNHNSSVNEEPSRNNPSEEDGFCGLEAAQRCAENLQAAWRIALGAETVTASLKVGADFVE
ncbi:hypothetical protein [Allorhodopirellula heiligendammensis]|uniref:Secreted protein n=1 Tax=Allorhodopirellula heiligendammensis TaxID=2714739 RepID=A0A5C6BW20_9BACT|nr:hypothetical protein [Allorhodopirellula heiligendammensis]TWU15631.1 hypothetical protein Poly21_28280 [Allorhodopirellula heiligendammensis]